MTSRRVREADITTNIYIDTNIFLEMYRANLKKDIVTIMNFIFQNKKHFVITEQTKNEFLRNRMGVLNSTLAEFLNQTSISYGASSFLRSLSSFKSYKESLQKLESAKNSVKNEIETITNNPEKDQVYKKFMHLCFPSIIKTTDAIVDSAHRRKLMGNPPTSDKYTCGDEIIWESLLSYERQKKNDLIIVTKDKTFSDNILFLSDEYFENTGKRLTVFDDLIRAYKSIGIECKNNVEQAADNLRWTDIIITALVNLGGQASLKEIYDEANDILLFRNCQSKLLNKAKESTIRGILQRFSSDTPTVYNGSKDLFHQVSDGIWALR